MLIEKQTIEALPIDEHFKRPAYNWAQFPIDYAQLLAHAVEHGKWDLIRALLKAVPVEKEQNETRQFGDLIIHFGDRLASNLDDTYRKDVVITGTLYADKSCTFNVLLADKITCKNVNFRTVYVKSYLGANVVYGSISIDAYRAELDSIQDSQSSKVVVRLLKAKTIDCYQLRSEECSANEITARYILVDDLRAKTIVCKDTIVAGNILANSLKADGRVILYGPRESEIREDMDCASLLTPCELYVGGTLNVRKSCIVLDTLSAREVIRREGYPCQIVRFNKLESNDLQNVV